MNCPICDQPLSEDGNVQEGYGSLTCHNGCYWENNDHGDHRARLGLNDDDNDTLTLCWGDREQPEKKQARELLARSFAEYLKFLKELEDQRRLEYDTERIANRLRQAMPIANPYRLLTDDPEADAQDAITYIGTPITPADLHRVTTHLPTEDELLEAFQRNNVPNPEDEDYPF